MESNEISSSAFVVSILIEYTSDGITGNLNLFIFNVLKVIGLIVRIV